MSIHSTQTGLESNFLSDEIGLRVIPACCTPCCTMVYYYVCVRILALEQVAPSSNVNNISLCSARPQRENVREPNSSFLKNSVKHVSVYRAAIVLKKNKASVLRHFIFTLLF